MRTGGKISGLLLLASLTCALAKADETSDDTILSEAEKAKLREQLPHYDPHKYIEGTAAPSPAAPIKNVRRPGGNASAPKPAPVATNPSGGTIAASEAAGKTISLSPYIVKAKPVEKRLARPGAIRRESDDRIDPFLSPSALQEAVTKKYLSSFDRNFLNRWTLPLFGVSNFQRAGALYQADMKAAELNQMADILEVPGENNSEKEKKEMRELYERVLHESRH